MGLLGRLMCKNMHAAHVGFFCSSSSISLFYEGFILMSDQSIKQRIKTYFVAGLLVVVPIGLTIRVVQTVIGWMDSLLFRALPPSLQPDRLLGFHIPGLGLVTSLFLIFMVGIFAANVMGRFFVGLFERFMYKIPLVKSIYLLFKQMTDTTLGRDRKGFRQVVLLEYPRRGIWSIGFVTGVTHGEIQRITEKKMVNVFVPTTPNPTSGFYLLVAEDDMVHLRMTVDEAFKLVISGGMVTPPDRGGGG
jgi:uncharacterized membrane protein